MLITYENNVGARVLSLTPKDVEEIQQLATTLHCAAARLAMERGDHQAMAAQLRRRAADFQSAQNIQAQVQAVHHLIEVFYLHCGNRRLDRSMLSIQGQQLLLRQLYAQAGMDVAQNAEDFERMYRGVEQNDVDGVCDAIVRNSDRLEQAVSQQLSQPDNL